jgi:hypothetical protein
MIRQEVLQTRDPLELCECKNATEVCVLEEAFCRVVWNPWRREQNLSRQLPISTQFRMCRGACPTRRGSIKAGREKEILVKERPTIEQSGAEAATQACDRRWYLAHAKTTSEWPTLVPMMRRQKASRGSKKIECSMNDER